MANRRRLEKTPAAASATSSSVESTFYRAFAGLGRIVAVALSASMPGGHQLAEGVPRMSDLIRCLSLPPAGGRHGAPPAKSPRARTTVIAGRHRPPHLVQGSIELSEGRKQSAPTDLDKREEAPSPSRRRESRHPHPKPAIPWKCREKTRPPPPPTPEPEPSGAFLLIQPKTPGRICD
jgi:hypothetical protein